MTNTLTEPQITTCPSWCTRSRTTAEIPLHRARRLVARPRRSDVRRYLFTGGTEYSTAPGVVANVAVDIHTDEHAMNKLTRTDLLDLEAEAEAEAVAAAEWLERVR
ncbi:hypothetical protein NPS01_21140 [Nocardioides psychrotolerans]|uniref:Uncharacterized protein n=1 Tax=Nocardioides psychrotolerans TaxID=1005945 RepID=A0A1I3KF01_9ACTN|nr:hypothetical protein [Nocardioides psychrotolerans]GEP38451.1 hypothetical protein NPS01_21140 [Nocardioides psychrotolerans]SFI71091.1 hypothetical protein SAMN05216561_11221 [Nocardioides psychrotolerans]